MRWIIFIKAMLGRCLFSIIKFIKNIDFSKKLNIIFIALILLFLLSTGAAYCLDNYQWNNGYSRESGRPWIYVRTNRRGERLYSDMSGQKAAIKYNVDKIKDKKKHIDDPE